MPPRINIPPVTRALLAVLLLQTLLSAVIRYQRWQADSVILIPYLVLIPQLSIVYPWTLVTTTLVEGNLFTWAIGSATIFYGGRYLERAWSSSEFAKFLAIVSLIPNALCFLALVILFTLSRSESWTLTPISGTIPLQISFLVAFSQLVPAHTVTLLRGIVSLRVPRFPLLYIGAVTVLSLTPLFGSVSFFLALSGFLTSWTYLRFYKPVFPDLDASQPSSLRGDASETFAFAEFFPGPVKPFVSTLSNQVFEVLVAMRLCTPFTQADLSAARGDNFLQRNAPGSARAEAERRRALALKALDQRLHAATANTPASRSTSQPPAQSPPPAAGPTVQVQPQPTAQAVMEAPPPAVLGATDYAPDDGTSKPG